MRGCWTNDRIDPVLNMLESIFCLDTVWNKELKTVNNFLLLLPSVHMISLISQIS